MAEYKDCIGRDIAVGDRVGVAFSYSRASVGYIRVGKVVSFEPKFLVRWEADHQVSRPMEFSSKRMVLL
ncbi:hypothetical protein PP459_gp115 [Streptomyces phage Wakanda]|uniref:Uncharacterized protein n=1 Tax=Streptomyces phage Wakanda TaxID=2713267 RepID=A0A6G8R2D2_9CAUD|nr:hypothetical protein PP459_gp115 [Streptomyces phage Wakanda]QIN94118.1 hypothetical protein SEA_WAKANDA_154 [Streptomyces phage Wakanda]